MKSVIGTVAAAPATAPALKGMPSFDAKAVSFCPISVLSILLLKTLPMLGFGLTRQLQENEHSCSQQDAKTIWKASEVPIWARAARKFEIILWLSCSVIGWLSRHIRYTLSETRTTRSHSDSIFSYNQGHTR